MYTKLYKIFFSAVSCMYMCMYLVMGETTVRFRARKNIKLFADHVDKNVSIDSLVMCVTLCKMEQSFLCQSASWRDGICLFSKTVAIDDALKPVVTKNENWITMCRVVYPVFLAMSDLGRYRLTFDKAKSRCLQSESRIASRKELMAARNLGYEKCHCGWLSDGTNGYVMQKHYPECSPVWHDGIIQCNRKLYDVYCKTMLL